MTMSPAQFETKILRRSTSPDEYRVYRAGLEWDLTDPIVIESRQDIKSEQCWRDQMEPYHHQVTNLITFCRRLPVTLLADDVGLGKTISAGLIASELISRARVSKILVVCPKLLGPQWVDELQTKFNIPAEIATGAELVRAEPKDMGAVITTYHSARLHLEKIPDDRFEMLILDEAHKLRNLYGVEKPPQVAVRFRKALEKRRFRFVLMLTATPIQNRLWDLYSLVDLLTVARGHQNPFGSEGMFARKFIADKRDQARRLNPEARDEFRSIVYGYMSRIRRGDAKLYFPDRVVQLHRVEPTAGELELIEVIAKPIQKLNRLAQISILQALTSSPHALMAQLKTMARNGTVPAMLSDVVSAIVGRMKTSAKLEGLGNLIDRLARENPKRWRMVVFTGRLETQTTIQAFLEERGIEAGIINGSSGPRNEETLARFRKNPPDYHVLVSTEAGSEGINLQIANVLANFDLPWNPMIVEQRIGRVQRLASEHARVSIFNIILRGTFEEYIVGRLMEKLQMATHAIGDIEALLEASGIGDDDEGGTSFDEKIRQLVVAALAGKDVEAATRLAEKSITDAKSELEREEKNINAMLGGMDGAEYVGPRAPKLPSAPRSMEPKAFALAALASLGARVSPHNSIYLAEQDGGREYIRFDEEGSEPVRSTLYAPGNAAFSRLVSRIIATGAHRVTDLDQNAAKTAGDIAREWPVAFGAIPVSTELDVAQRCFEGRALVRVRATVAHDSYERLIDVSCRSEDHRGRPEKSAAKSIPDVIQDAAALGVNADRLIEAANGDPCIAEFCRFYLERRAQEMQAAGEDDRKRKKLDDEFTPRLAMTLVGLEGEVSRQIKMHVCYRIDDSPEYTSTITVTPHIGEVGKPPSFGRCASTGKSVPRDCLARCEMSGREVLRHLLVKSDVSARQALPEYSLVCSLSGKRLLLDEAALSAVSGQPVARALLKTSALSGKLAEPKHFARCEFTQSELLLSELAVSEISGKRYRIDEQDHSAISGKAGHRSEFIQCYETRQPLLPEEAERCDITGHAVRPGILEPCAVTRKRVLPSELERCAVTGKKALKSLFVTSSLSEARVLEQEAIRSAAGKFCLPSEAKTCTWSGRQSHPDDIRICDLAGVPIHYAFVTTAPPPRLEPLVRLLEGTQRTADDSGTWEDISSKVSTALHGGRCRIEAAVAGPDHRHLAVCAELKTMLGFKVRHAGLIFSLDDNAIIGRIVVGKRTQNGWAVKV